MNTGIYCIKMTILFFLALYIGISAHIFLKILIAVRARYIHYYFHIIRCTEEWQLDR